MMLHDLTSNHWQLKRGEILDLSPLKEIGWVGAGYATFWEEEDEELFPLAEESILNSEQQYHPGVDGIEHKEEIKKQKTANANVNVTVNGEPVEIEVKIEGENESQNED